MLNVILFNVFKAIKDIGFLACFVAVFWFLDDKNMLIRLFAIGLISAIFSMIVLRFIKNDFRFFGLYGVFNTCYGSSFSAFAIGVIFNYFRDTPNFYVYYVSIGLFFIGFVGKIIFSKKNLK